MTTRSREPVPGPRILIARPDHLGDVLLTLPAASALRRALPEAIITLLTPLDAAAIPCRCPDVDATVAVRYPPLTVAFDRSGWAEAAAREAATLRGHFDLALLPRPDDPWTAPLVAAAKIPVRVGYDSPRTRPFLTTALPVTPRCHVAHLGLGVAAAAVRLLGGPPDVDGMAPAPRFVPTESDEAEAGEVLATTVPPLGAAPVALHPGSGWPLKNWPAGSWGALAATLWQDDGTRPLVTGSGAEAALVDAVVAASGGRAIGLAGRLSFGGLAALYRRCRLVIATDGGPLHLAAAVGTPVVGLYGPADPLEFGPWCPPERQRTVRVSLPCSPCRTLVDPPCGATAHPTCVTGIAVKTVLDAARDLLGRVRPPGVVL